MAWQYSSPLGSALLAANGGQSETLGLGSTSIYQPYFSSYDPLFTTRYQPRTNFFDRSLFDDLELELEVDDTLLSTNRYKPSVYSNQASSYVPSYFNSLKTSLNQTNNNYDSLGINNTSNNYEQFQNDDSPKQSKQELNRQHQQQVIPHQQQPVTYTDNLKKQTKQTNLKNKKTNTVNPVNNNANKQIKKQTNTSYPNFGTKNAVQPVQAQPSQQQQQQPNFTPNYQRLFQPLPFQQTPTIYNNINSVESSANIDNNLNNHNNQQLRFLQYQQRLLQQQEMNKNENLSELEVLKLRQQQEKQQLLQAIAANANKERNQNQYQPFFQDLNQKQYSETSIPSTNADPLNSNNPTPPLNHRAQKFEKPIKPNNQSNFQLKKTQGFYYKLNEKQNEDQAEPSSYLNTMRDTRIREQRLTKDKYSSQDYKQYQKNYGFGKDFLPFETETKKEKQEKARKREEYSKMIKERNTVLMDGIIHNPNKYEKYNPTIYTLNDPVTKRNQATLNKAKN